MGKRGQITYFIIIGIVILLLALSSFFIYNTFIKERIEREKVIPTDIVPISNFIQSCIHTVSIPGIYLLSSNGGYIYEYENTVKTDTQEVAYHLISGNDVSPSREYMQDELSRFVAESLPLCLNNFQDFKGYSFEYGRINVDSKININSIFIKVDYPITIYHDDAKTIISKFNIEVDSRLGFVLDEKDELVSEIILSDDIDLINLSEHELDISLMPYNEDTLVYAMIDNAISIDDAPFIFNFAIKDSTNLNPRMDPLPDFILLKGRTFTYQVNADDPDGDLLTFTSSNPSISIGAQSGIISFLPDQSIDYETDICVRDMADNEDCQYVRFMVENE